MYANSGLQTSGLVKSQAGRLAGGAVSSTQLNSKCMADAGVNTSMSASKYRHILSKTIM